MKESEKNQNILLGSIAVVFMMFICLLPSYAEESLWDKLTAFEELRKEILVLDQEKRYEEAAKIAEKVVNIGAEIYGPEHPNVELALKNFAAVLNNLAEEYVSKGRYDESVSFDDGTELYKPLNSIVYISEFIELSFQISIDGVVQLEINEFLTILV